MLAHFPPRLVKAFKRVDFRALCEVRIRQNKKVLLIYNNGFKTLDITLSAEEIEEIVYSACKKSIYSYEEQIKRGYVTTESGVRIGLGGEFVIKDDEVLTIKNFSSLCIRFPHQICGFATPFVKNYYNGGSVLVISKSGAGKTTFIRDFSREVNLKFQINTVIIDERNEIAALNNGTTFDLGENVDILTYSTKNYGFNQAVRTLNPALIITDELMNEDDINGVNTAILSGVDVIATIHAKSLNNALNKNFIKPYKNLFDYYILIEFISGKRVVTAYNKSGEELCKY